MTNQEVEMRIMKTLKCTHKGKTRQNKILCTGLSSFTCSSTFEMIYWLLYQTVEKNQFYAEYVKYLNRDRSCIE